MKKGIASLLFIVAAGLIVWWFAAGHHMWTTTKQSVDVETKDEIFGTVTHETKWVDHLTPGLMGSGQLSTPADFILIGPEAGAMILIGGWLLLSGRRREHHL